MCCQSLIQFSTNFQHRNRDHKCFGPGQSESNVWLRWHYAGGTDDGCLLMMNTITVERAESGHPGAWVDGAVTRMTPARRPPSTCRRPTAQCFFCFFFSLPRLPATSRLIVVRISRGREWESLLWVDRETTD